MTIPEDIHSLALKVLEFKTLLYIDRKWFMYNPDSGVYIKRTGAQVIQEMNKLYDVLPEYHYYLTKIMYKKQVLEKLKKLCTRTVEFDKHAHLLGMPNGVIDLATMEVRPGRPLEYITMTTSVPYSPDTSTEDIERVLKEVFPVDSEREYALTVFAKSLFPTEDSPVLNYSNSFSGKTTMQRLLSDTLNDYSERVPIKTLLNPKGYLKNKRHAYCDLGTKEFSHHIFTFKDKISSVCTSYRLRASRHPRADAMYSI